jgi:hypothetical protein
MAIDRVITREILDHLPASDARAVRARRDLRVINALMGNVRWIRQGLRRVIENSALPPTAHLVELGAGDGGLSRKVVSWFPAARVTGVDLAPRPRDLPKEIAWRQGDLLDNLPGCGGECVFGTMILHHFRDDQLADIGESVFPFRALCFCEPWRARFPHLLGLLIRPLCGSVARHDLPVSIDAGFVRGELPQALGLKNWQIRESVDWRGSLRLVAWKG